jgi:glycosyl hydrolase family 2
MTNRITRVEVLQQRLSTLEAELMVRVEAATMTPGMELRGRLVGPKCPGIESVQVAYPLRPLPAAGSVLVARVTIPEPNLWTEEQPFVYEGVVEVWHGGVKCDSASFTIALKSH